MIPILFITLFSATAFASIANNNALTNHDSPYLAMHDQDPVHWQLWSDQVLKSAKAQNKLILISSGYFSCHWCHVMQKENYQNKTTAQYLNQHFISVKIDRELNAGLDQTLIEFAKKATGQAGWPQHVILTPEGLPFAGFIYQPNKTFNQTLRNIIRVWQSQPDKIRQIALSAVAKPPIIKAMALSAKDFEDKLLQQVEQLKDDLSGGLIGSAKFPQAPLLKSLLQIKTLPNSIEEWLIFTLEQMQSQHLFDHVHGGFYRYTVDPEWQTPHFEKMAYSSALLAEVYLLAGQRFQRRDFLQTAVDTLSYLEQHLYNPVTKLYQSSQSAIDRNNNEGGDYLWSKEKLQKTLNSTEFQAVKQAWNFDIHAPYELGFHPKALSTKTFSQANLLWPSIRQKLQTDPNQIPIDSKSILGWNGLILSAYVKAFQVLKSPRYQQRANLLAKQLLQLINNNHPPRALSLTGSPMGQANLEDYAYIYQGLSQWQALNSNQALEPALEKLAQTIKDRFYNETGWQYQASPLLPGQFNQWQMKDDALPSPAAIVSCLSGVTFAYASEALVKRPIQYASYLQKLEQCSATIPK